ncbi:hypothetical protein DL237_10520 [Pseudooceanicola sediminis]|uniref:Uncharacterized protein n=1 Tax=Pseudooceanicola sediminis TaxID=2211117 RepID=A0A399IZZ7_9RHOB|nr:hypothetical protein [Pseudooceanicola sediminis]KAA2313867.1 hypothetical protein E0K93_12210 [Puniceibacterium sp. HSS470]RII38685.1 hypothetical protein DL237_10520 [Pseudooceanicola sediminis]
MKPERGAEPVATIAALPFHEVLLIGALRARCDGPDEMAIFATELAALYGEGGAARLLDRLDEFLGLTLRHVRRPVMRHGQKCSCVGADEAVLAHLVTISTSGDREDAMLMACLLVRADVAPIVVSLAQTLGLELLRTAPVAPRFPAMPSETLH